MFFTKIKEENLFRSYFLFTFLLLTATIASIGYFLVEKEKAHAKEEIKTQEKKLIAEKKL